MQSVSEIDPGELERLAKLYESESPQDVLRWGIETFPGGITLACSFGAEDVALVDMLARIDPSVPIFYLDTDYLFPETLEVRDRIEARYGVRTVAVKPALTVDEQAARHGADLFSTRPDLCCAIRKVEPLRGHLSGFSAWITGIRRDQSPARARAGRIEWDRAFSLVKLNPLAPWSSRDVWAYIRAHDVPYNTLHDRNYPSIGCHPCTRPVQPGEDPRAGRWANFAKTECGLHADTGSSR
ncbi:MAG TPA: phosphoadenylyl-sulfate reductase [Candidatus Polarisedimenticolia bacterium]|nr:phosphoadenylyl-sulfate reductase [Candidatus Polarisedimenticolia bacterium]